MRAIIWTLAVFACASHAAEGQTVNLRAGGSFTKLVQDRESYRNTTDFTAGISLDIPAPGLPFRIGATWVRKHESAEHIEIAARGPLPRGPSSTTNPEFGCPVF